MMTAARQTLFRALIYLASVAMLLGGAIALAGAQETVPSAVAPATSTGTVTPPVQPVPPATPAVTPPAAASESGAEFIGADTCISCHQGQAGFHDSVHAKAFKQLKGVDLQQSCEKCHGPGSLHAAAAGDRSNPGFGTVKVFKTMKATQVNETCMECHQDQKRMHWLGSRHEARNVSCVGCHSVHASKAPDNLLVEATVDKTCAKCHRDIANKVRRNSHMPVAEGKMSCSSCHNPHGSATHKMLVEDSVATLCQSCHTDKRGPFVWEHQPVRENCSNCHDAHGSHHESMLVAKLPFLCQRCHIGQRHPATPYGMTDVSEVDNKIAGKSCQGCHSNIHGSNHPSGNFFLR